MREYFFSLGEKNLDNAKKICKIEIQFYSLIKSGGGTGPVKPGNLHLQGAKSGE